MICGKLTKLCVTGAVVVGLLWCAGAAMAVPPSIHHDYVVFGGKLEQGKDFHHARTQGDAAGHRLVRIDQRERRTL